MIIMVFSTAIEKNDYILMRVIKVGASIMNVKVIETRESFSPRHEMLRCIIGVGKQRNTYH